MIQRPQTLILFLFCALTVVNAFFYPQEELVFSTLLTSSASYSPWVSLLFSVIVLLNIFMYKNRPLQININRYVWVLFTLFWAGYVYLVLQNYSHRFSDFLPDLLIAFLGEICLLTANRFIRKDENLVRSMDRLR